MFVFCSMKDFIHIPQHHNVLDYLKRDRKTLKYSLSSNSLKNDFGYFYAVLIQIGSKSFSRGSRPIEH